MKVAVTYDSSNGTVFQHFGKTENFKLYEIEQGNILSTEVIDNAGTGHEALAGVLAAQGVVLVICGGLGGGMQSALDAAGIAVISGAQGDADEAINAFLRGELNTAGVNCDHHHGEGEAEGCGGCGDGEEGCGGCGGGCGGCHGGCGGEPVIILEGRNAGKKVRVHYRGTFDDGTQFDSSYDRGEPMEFLSGAGMMIPGFDKAVVDMEPGQKVEIHLEPEEAYGMPDPANIITLLIEDLAGSEDLVVGQRIFLKNMMGQSFPVVVTEKDDERITFDANHEMAGKALNFAIELLEVLE